VYNTRVEENNNHVSYNGGNGGVVARPTPEEEAAARGRHLPPVAEQTQHESVARSTPSLRASANHGNPPIGATARPGDFEHSTASALGTEGDRAGAVGEAGGKAAIHPKDLPAINHPAPLEKGASKVEKNYQKQQEKLAGKQEQERNKLQQQQEKEHQKKLNADQTERLEQKHQQQTQQLAQRHTSEQQSLQSHAPAPRAERPR
jgi:hypothetical protein